MIDFLKRNYILFWSSHAISNKPFGFWLTGGPFYGHAKDWERIVRCFLLHHWLNAWLRLLYFDGIMHR